MNEFKGRVLIPGSYSGKVFVSHQNVNYLASFKGALTIRDIAHFSLGGLIGLYSFDKENKDIYRCNITSAALALPKSVGSTLGSSVLQSAISLGIGPKCMLFAEKIDPISSGAIIVSSVWENKDVVVIDCLGIEFLNSLNNGDIIEVSEDGRVLISQKNNKKTKTKNSNKQANVNKAPSVHNFEFGANNNQTPTGGANNLGGVENQTPMQNDSPQNPPQASAPNANATSNAVPTNQNGNVPQTNSTNQPAQQQPQQAQPQVQVPPQQPQPSVNSQPNVNPQPSIGQQPPINPMFAGSSYAQNPQQNRDKK